MKKPLSKLERVPLREAWKHEARAEGKNQMTVEKIKDTEQAWDDRKLGAQPEFVGVADDSHEKALQEALECEVLQRNAARMSPQTGRKPA